MPVIATDRTALARGGCDDAIALRHAEELHERGFSLLPLCGKRPHVPALQAVHDSSSWSPLRSRRASVAEVRAWAEVDPQIAFGVITGNGLLVIDVDRSASALKHPPTPVVRTGRGWHIYVAGERPGQKLPFGDLKGEGGYVVAAGSEHECGVRYEWVVTPDEAELARIDEVSGLAAVGAVPALPSGGTKDHRVFDATAPATASEGPWWLDGRAVAMVLPVLGITAPIGQAFCCVLPGHHETHPSASINPNTFVYVDWHQGGAAYQLAEVYASQCRGRATRLSSGPALGRWTDRLAREAGLLDVELPVPYIPNGLRPSELKVVRGFVLLLALNRLRHPEGPVAFALDFAVAWCGVPRTTAAVALRRLRELDVIRRVDQIGSGPRTVNLYELGDGTRSVSFPSHAVAVRS